MIAALLFSALAFARPTMQYTSPTSQEGTLTFTASVYATDSARDPRALIDKQLTYMIGNLQYRAEGTHGTPSTLYQISNIDSAPQADGSTRINYRYSGRMIFEKSQSDGDFKFDLPRDPLTIDAKAGDKQCTSNTTEPLWYGFNPYVSGCALREGRDFDVITAQVKITPNPKETYPEYARLKSSDGAIHMSVLMNNEIEDVNGYIEELNDAGFKGRQWSQQEIVKKLGFAPAKMPDVYDFEIPGLKINLFFGVARVEDLDGSKAFHAFYRDALANANVVSYNGHSGLGSNIDLELIEKNEGFKFQFSKNYQLMFLGGCITYAYYVDKYLARKATPADPRGTRNLDVLTFGTESPGFDERPLMALTDALQKYVSYGTRESYQSLTNQIDYSWFGVVGDEDNP